MELIISANQYPFYTMTATCGYVLKVHNAYGSLGKAGYVAYVRDNTGKLVWNRVFYDKDEAIRYGVNELTVWDTQKGLQEETARA